MLERVRRLELPDDWLEAVLAVAVLAMVSSSAYLRGRLDESGMGPMTHAQHVAESGPHWPMALMALGLVVGVAAFATLYLTREKRGDHR